MDVDKVESKEKAIYSNEVCFEGLSQNCEFVWNTSHWCKFFAEEGLVPGYL